MANVDELFRDAVTWHRAGDLQQAARAYREVLALEPRHARSLGMLGRIALAGGDTRAAIDCAVQAIDVDPTRAEFYFTLAEAQRALGQLAEAVASYRAAIDVGPNDARAHANLGTLLQAQGDLTAAAESYRHAIALAPDNAGAHHNLGVALQLQGELQGAADEFAEAARLNPAALESRLALGYLLKAQGKDAAALAFFQQAVAANPAVPAAHAGLGFMCQHQGQFDEAIRHFARACELEPGNALWHHNLATALRNKGRAGEALDSFHESMRRDPTFGNAYIGASAMQLALGRADEAVAAARRAVELAGGSHAAIAQLAAALHARGDLDEAIAANRRALEIDPHDAGGHSNLVNALNAHEDYDAQAIFAEHRAWAARHAEPLTATADGHLNDRDPERRLRVGYVSAHFRHQAVSFFSEPMIAAHDHRAFEIYCYSDVEQPDAVTERFRGHADQWRDVAGTSDAALAELVRRDQIDILVDLAGHIGGNRLRALARKPAPVQVTYIGYQNTTGMSAMDYRLTDEHADPPGMTDGYYAERLVRLPRVFFCYQPPDFAPDVNALPALGAGRVTFGSLNQPFKIRPAAWAAWSRILAAVPNSRLLVLGHAGSQFERNGREIVAAAGVDPARVEVVNQRPRSEYLRLHHEIDIALDSFPLGGHTTVCEALWMGVPSVMLEGGSYASRFGGSALVNLGLTDLIARTGDEYVEIAVRLAGQLDRLAELRRTMRGRMQDSPLLDAAGFARNLEDAYRRMWRAWCESK